MRLFSLLLVVFVLLVGSTFGVPVAPPLSPYNTSIIEQYDLFGDYYKDETIHTNISIRSSKYHPDDILPIQDLPKCYQTCMESNCCNGWPSLGDVRKLTVHEWCHSKWIPVQNWIYDHYQFCVKDACQNCKIESRDESIRWQKEVCSNS
ncbi:uncharacterized protein F4822DRAFT_430880 [Hypoxylon trugodes]|uniref:uncharacterized protein n=1 Tax=Hypoxylon trugodes TaxID=326681 RepID=UPI0021931098|nr:uncharacterized protein F4822DRAFT_430880 [Hypoxylon trugodes]KAI1388126.1 hypothetical protein F4822DRAFT_430880 [Hypoxylon trugodes]